MKLKKDRICMIASNDILNDPRVQKEAASAAMAGFDVRVIGLHQNRSPLSEHRPAGETTYQIERVGQGWFKFIAMVRTVIEKISGTFLEFFKRGNETEGKESELLVTELSGTNAFLKYLNANRFIHFTVIVINNIFYLTKLVQLKPYICHCNDLDTLTAGYVFKKISGCKLVYDAHELWIEMDPNESAWWKKVWGFLEKMFTRKAEMVISVNKSICEELEKRYAVKRTVSIFNCPFSIRIRRKVPASSDDRKLILYQGRYDPYRGLEELIESAQYINNGVLALRGYGVMEEELRKLAVSLGLNSTVKFLSPVNMSELVQAASEADIGIVPYRDLSLDYVLCTPNKIFEYMMAGLAVGVSDLPELKRIVNESGNGVIFDASDPRDIAAKINSILEDEQLLLNMKKNSLKASYEKYNWENEARKLIDVYRSLSEREYA